MRIDIISDVVCPWCIIGFKQLDAALAERGIAHDVHWHPFELNPNMPREGQNLREHIMQKYGTSPADSAKSRDRMTAMGSDLGFTFAYRDDTRMWNTFQAHQLLTWAAETEHQHALKLALFAAHFTDGRDIADPEVLADVAASVGLDRAEAAAVLTDGRFADQVRQEEAGWQQQGIQGVPAIILNQRYLVSGAQGVETFGRILDKIAEQPQPVA